jgi:hypothetical protein
MKPSLCTHNPLVTQGTIGMYHCPECGEMVLAGMEHPGIMEAKDWEEMHRYYDSHPHPFAVVLGLEEDKL